MTKSSDEWAISRSEGESCSSTRRRIVSCVNRMSSTGFDCDMGEGGPVFAFMFEEL